jgi:predicted glycosyltransferase
MRYAFFTNTPAHVHLYKWPVRRLQEDGHEVLILARDYGCTEDLLSYYDLPHVIYGSCGTTKGSLFFRLPGHYARIAREIRRFRPDLVFGMGGYAAHASVLARCRCVLVIDSEPTSLDHRISTPFADVILTPAAFRKELGTNHYEFDGFKESAYLHPAVFEPDPSIRSDLGLARDEPFAVLRFNAFGSHHDVGHSGFSQEHRERLIGHLAQEVTVLVSDEGGDLDLSRLDARTFDLHPARMHDALAKAELLVADTQTMVTEAALLGTPAVRSNSFVGEDDMGNFKDLAEAGLVHNTADFETVLDITRKLLTDRSHADEWQQRRDTYVADMVNLTSLLVDIAVNDARMDDVEPVTPPARVRHS